MTSYILPELPYDYSALEPFVSAKTMELHHDKHHAAYVAGANKALSSLAEASENEDPSMISRYTRDLAFNLAGHVNHSLFWKNLSPDGGGEPAGRLSEALTDSFGSFGLFKTRFDALATSMQGSGWVMLALEPAQQSLMIFQLHDHQDGFAAGVTPLLMLDMWEHAFYLDYKNVKTDYVNAFWSFINWDDVSSRFYEASTHALQSASVPQSST